MSHRTQIMYTERKVELSGGEARIGRVTFSKSGSSLSYGGKTFRSLKGGGDRLYGERIPIHIDEDVRVEYWEEIRNAPERVAEDCA